RRPFPDRRKDRRLVGAGLRLGDAAADDEDSEQHGAVLGAKRQPRRARAALGGSATSQARRARKKHRQIGRAPRMLDRVHRAHWPASVLSCEQQSFSRRPTRTRSATGLRVFKLPPRSLAKPWYLNGAFPAIHRVDQRADQPWLDT